MRRALPDVLPWIIAFTASTIAAILLMTNAQLDAQLDLATPSGHFYDALRSARSYRQAWDRDSAVAQIEADAGSHFDPRRVEAFLPVVDEWETSFAEAHA
jgi:hypothetical protein